MTDNPIQQSATKVYVNYYYAVKIKAHNKRNSKLKPCCLITFIEPELSKITKYFNYAKLFSLNLNA